MLCTSPKFFWKLLWLDDMPINHGKFDWNFIYEETNINKIKYAFEVIESFLISDEKTLD